MQTTSVQCQVPRRSRARRLPPPECPPLTCTAPLSSSTPPRPAFPTLRMRMWRARARECTLRRRQTRMQRLRRVLSVFSLRPTCDGNLVVSVRDLGGLVVLALPELRIRPIQSPIARYAGAPLSGAPSRHAPNIARYVLMQPGECPAPGRGAHPLMGPEARSFVEKARRTCNWWPHCGPCSRRPQRWP